MARTPNPNNRYSFTCKVTNVPVKTNPKQFASLAERYGITPEELDTSYVSRAGRRQIASEALTPEQAVEKYGIHINVARNLKCTAKGSKPAVVVVPEVVSPENTETVAVAETVDA
jgi:hypothetical protein